MKFIALISGGKDSIYSIMECLRNGHELVACAHLSPRRQRPPSSSSNTPNGGVDDNDDDNKQEEEEESYMYQTAASECLSTLVTECLGVPLLLRECSGRSCNTSLTYDHHGSTTTPTTTTTTTTNNTMETTTNTDEVEDMYHLLHHAQRTYPTLTAVSSGAILSTYQRTRIENVCGRLGLTPLGYLWRIQPQKELLEQMVHRDGVVAALVKVAAPPGLIPSRHLGRTLGEMHCGDGGGVGMGGLFGRLHKQYGFHYCGEGGEYETLVLDCPIYRKRLVLVETEIREEDDGVGVLVVHRCEAVEKEKEEEVEGGTGAGDGDGDGGGDAVRKRFDAWRTKQQQHAIEDKGDEGTNNNTSCGRDTNDTGTSTTTTIISNTNTSQSEIPRIRHLPYIRILSGGLAHVSEILSPTTVRRTQHQHKRTSEEDEAELAVAEARLIFSVLNSALSSIAWNHRSSLPKSRGNRNNDSDDGGGYGGYGATAQDVVFVHLYLTDITHFARINSYYKAFFGTVLPPSRSCVAVGPGVLPGGRRVMLDCLVQRGSGAFMRPPPTSTPTHSPLPSSMDGNNNNNNVVVHKNPNEQFIQRCWANPHHQLRSTLHVQTVSHWAPVCVGPYSQANVLRSGVVFLAGQIGLVPSTMTLIEGGWEAQLVQCWTNAAAVLDGLENGCLGDVLGGVVYLGSDVVVVGSSDCGRSSGDTAEETEGGDDGGTVVDTGVLARAEHLCRTSLAINGGIEVGRVDGTTTSTSASLNHEGSSYDGFNAYDTWKEVMGPDATDVSSKKGSSTTPVDEKDVVPLLMVALPQMPMGAKAEVELVCATSRASSYLDLVTSYVTSALASGGGGGGDTETTPSSSCGTAVWDLGYDDGVEDDDGDPSNAMSATGNPFDIRTVVRSLGVGCAAITYVLATYPVSNTGTTSDETRTPLPPPICIESVLQEMLSSAITSVEHNSAYLNRSSILHVRLFYSTATTGTGGDDDGVVLRGDLRSALRSFFRGNGDVPACTVVPVKALSLFPSPYAAEGGGEEEEGIARRRWFAPSYAMQILTADLVHLETELWVHRDRGV